MGIIELLAVVLLLAWLAGAVIVPVGTSLIHVLIFIVAVVVIVRLIKGEKIL